MHFSSYALTIWWNHGATGSSTQEFSDTEQVVPITFTSLIFYKLKNNSRKMGSVNYPNEVNFFLPLPIRQTNSLSSFSPVDAANSGSSSG